MNEKDLQRELAVIINRHNLEYPSNTRDFVLADYLINCLKNYNESVTQERAHQTMDDYLPLEECTLKVGTIKSLAQAVEELEEKCKSYENYGTIQALDKENIDLKQRVEELKSKLKTIQKEGYPCPVRYNLGETDHETGNKVFIEIKSDIKTIRKDIRKFIESNPKLSIPRSVEDVIADIYELNPDVDNFASIKNIIEPTSECIKHSLNCSKIDRTITKSYNHYCEHPYEYKVWECKIVVPFNAKLPAGFDAVPRSAAQNAVESKGIPTCAIFSGWGGKLDDSEIEAIKSSKTFSAHSYII